MSVLLALIAALMLGVLLIVATLIVFPAANVLRTAARNDPSRFVRQALGSHIQIRDLGDQWTTETALGPVEVRLTWTRDHTRLELTGSAAAMNANTLETLRKIGSVESDDPLTWKADRPPDPQLVRVMKAVRDGASRSQV